MSKSPKHCRIEELARFSDSLHIFDKNYEDLCVLLAFLCDAPEGEHLFVMEGIPKWKLTMCEVLRLLQNLITSASVIVAHSTYLHRRLCEPRASFSEYKGEVMVRIEKNPVVQFVRELGDYCLRHPFPSLATTMEFLDIRAEKTKRNVLLYKSAMLDFEWNPAARQYLGGAAESVDLRELLAAYYSQMVDFGEWFGKRMRVLCAVE